MDSDTLPDATPLRPLDTAEIGAIAHLYRGEVYRSTIWRTRLDNTTNWAVVTLGIALSVTFASPESSPLPLILVGLLIFAFLNFEARRYRYFNVWRARARWMETHFYAPILRGEGITALHDWRNVLAEDYCKPHYHISYMRALGRRLRRNYSWILAIQAVAYYGKVAVHPSPLQSMTQLYERAAIGPVPGQIMVPLGLAYYAALVAIAFMTMRQDRRRHGGKEKPVAMG
jgi:uncharacterized membrane protein